MRRRLPLRLRIAFATALSVVVAVSGMALAGYAIVAHELDRSLNLSLTREVTRLVREDSTLPGRWTPSGPCVFLAAPACVQKITSDGHVEPVQAPASTLPVDSGTLAVAAGARPAYFSDVSLEGHPVRMLTAPLAPGTAVEVAVRSDRINESLSRIGFAFRTAGLVGVLLAAAAGYVVARAGLRPVTAVTATAERVARTRDPRHRISVEGDDEPARLAASFNTMLAELQQALDALEDSLAAQRRLVADASHELHAPLTGLRTNIDLLNRGDRLPPQQRSEAIDALRAQAAELTGLVTDLIELARGDDPDAREEAEDVRLDHLVGHCIDRARRHWPDIAFEAELDATLVEGTSRTLARAVTNLLDNAAKFSPDNGVVRVELHDNELTVRDHGPGIPADARDHVFDRFYRAPSARGLPGTGLGLAIVRQVATAHHAILSAETPVDGGTLIRMRFPG